MKNKQTAIEWLWHHMMVSITRPSKEMLEQAKEMEKEQIIKAHTHAYLIGENDISINDANNASQKYYNETYGE